MAMCSYISFINRPHEGLHHNSYLYICCSNNYTNHQAIYVLCVEVYFKGKVDMIDLSQHNGFEFLMIGMSQYREYLEYIST